MDGTRQSLEQSPPTARRLAKSLGFHVVQVSQYFFKRMHPELLTPSQGFVLHLLLDGRAWRVSDLASAAGVRASSMTELIARMERQGWLSKTDVTHDKRGVEVTLTETGRTVVQTLERSQLDLLAQRITLLSDEEKFAIERALPALERLFSG